MAIEKNNFKVSRFDSELLPRCRESMSSGDEGEPQRQSSAAVESDDDEEFDDADSGAGSDDFDLLELGETRAEFCQVENQTCSLPFELYDLSCLADILSVEVWNNSLSEEERFSLTKYLPDLDQDTFMQTLKELFSGCNFHFGSPISKLFNMLKGGLCEPRVALYQQGLNCFQMRQHYHLLRKHQNGWVGNLCQLRDVWLNCRGYSIEERLRVLNIMRSQKSLMYEKMEDLGSDSLENEDSGEGLWSKRFNDRKIAQKAGRQSAYGVSSNVDFPLRGQSVNMEPGKYRKQNPKGILKLAGLKMPLTKELVGGFPSVHQSFEIKPRPDDFAVATLPRKSKVTGYDSGLALRIRDQMILDDDAEDPIYGIRVQRDRNVSRGTVMDKGGVLKVGKKHDLLRGDEFATDSLMGLPLSSKNDLHAYGRNRNVLTAKSLNMNTSYDFAKKANYPENVQQFTAGEQMKPLKCRAPQLPLTGTQADLSDRPEPIWRIKSQGEALSLDSSFKYGDLNVRGNKWKTERESSDLNFSSRRASSPHMSNRFLHSEFRAHSSQEKIRGNYVQNGGPDMPASRGNSRVVIKDEESESDSYEQLDDNEDNNPLLRSKLAYPGGVMEGSLSSFVKSGLYAKKAKFSKKDEKENTRALHEIAHSAKKMGDIAEHVHMPGVQNYFSKTRKKGKMCNSSPLRNSAVRGSSRVFEDGSLSHFGKDSDDHDRKQIYKLGKNGQLRGKSGERLHASFLKAYAAERRQKGETGHDHSMPQSNYLRDYIVNEEDDSIEAHLLADANIKGRSGKKGQGIEAYVNDHRERSKAPLLGYNSASKKRKVREDVTDMDGPDEDGNLQSNLKQLFDDSTSLKKWGKRQLEADGGTSEMETSERPVTEMEATDVELESKPPKKPFTLITPTVHTGFSFSIMHLLSAVRMAMITPLPEDSIEVGKSGEEHIRKHEGINNGILFHENMDVNNSGNTGQVNVPSLTIHEIVNRMRLNPGDPCILETQEPLQDLVRGVLKIFSSKTAPLGAKGWKVLVAYEKPTKSWTWIGSVFHSSSDHETIEEVTSPEVWGLPHKMLIKLVDSFANWLKSGQDTLRQIGSLPAPPVALMHFNMDEKERFRDLRAQKSLNTFKPSTEEVRDYFRKEEVLRYSIPDRAFSYTATDGKTSIVAPLRRCGGKPTSKARDHFMLKRDRPPHVTILCLVRDAAARLPGSIGTRADVCTLIRDSQYIVEDVSDAQVNQVVSGALDRLHYERDPCVQFDAERKLWVYLHREREEEDFEDDGTSSTKKWKRPKKDAAEQSNQGTVTVAYHGTGEQTGLDVCSDLNVEPSCIDDDKIMELAYNDVRENVEDNVYNSHGSEHDNVHQCHPMVWETLGINPTQENKLLCQENSTNEDFDDETYG